MRNENPAVRPKVATLPGRDLDHILYQARDCWAALAGTRIFITGGTGFVGKWLLESLLWVNDLQELNIGVTVLTRDPSGFHAECPHLASHRAVALWEGDACSFSDPSGAFPFVIHAATERSFPADSQHPASTFDRDVAGTRRLLEFARAHGTKRLLFTSSGAVYGTQPPDLLHVPEDYPGAPSTLDPASTYGQAKRVSEFLCAMYGRQYGFDSLIARLFAFAGPHLPMNENFAVGNFVRDALRGGPVRVKGNGAPYRSYLYAADLATWLWTILVRGESARAYNVGSAEAVSIAELAGLVARLAGPGKEVEIAGQPVAGMPAPRYVPCVERARVELGLRALIPLEESIQRTLDWTASSQIYGQNIRERQAK